MSLEDVLTLIPIGYSVSVRLANGDSDLYPLAGTGFAVGKEMLQVFMPDRIGQTLYAPGTWESVSVFKDQT